MRIAFVLLAAAFFAADAAIILTAALAGFDPDPLADGLLRAGFVLAFLAAVLSPKGETAEKLPFPGPEGASEPVRGRVDRQRARPRRTARKTGLI